VYTTQNPTHTFVNSGNTNATLTVTASNDCIHSFNRTIVVPAKLTPDFSVSRNCTEQQTLFTDITNATADPVSSHSWNFGGLGTASGSPATFTFLNTGNVNVTLNLTTQTGCEYPVSKAVNIGSPPQSNFTTSPETGSPPLIVEFTNTSTGSITYLWNFSDLSTSTQVSPSFTFEDVGEYEVSLIAYNAFDCSDTTYHEILVSPITGLEHDGNFYFEPPYPNPGNGNLFLGWTALQPGNLSVTVLDIFGRTILASDLLSTVGHNETVISLSGLKAGVYFMQMRLGERKKTFRVTVNPE
jgi:PKD repeat protein